MHKKKTPLFISVASAGYIESRYIRDRFSRKGVRILWDICDHIVIGAMDILPPREVER